MILFLLSAWIDLSIAAEHKNQTKGAEILILQEEKQEDSIFLHHKFQPFVIKHFYQIEELKMLVNFPHTMIVNIVNIRW